jgi:hypothetical protein
MRQRLLQVLASALGSSAILACSDDPSWIREGFDETVCTEGELKLLANLNPATPADYVALRADGPESRASVIEESGEGTQFLLTKEELKTFLGTIDTPQEAALLTRVSGFNLTCERPNLDTRTDGYLIYAESGHTCGDNLRGHQVFVRADGSVSELHSVVLAEGDPTCQVGRLPQGLWPQLTAAQQAEVRSVHLQAIAQFRASAAEQPCPDAVTLLGMPESHRALALFDALFRDVPPDLV